MEFRQKWISMIWVNIKKVNFLVDEVLVGLIGNSAVIYMQH